MATVDYNQVLNAFIDSLSFENIPNRLKNDRLMAVPPGRDRMCAAVVNMVAEWQEAWAKTGNNFDKNKIIQDVEDSRELIVRRESEKELIDETRISLLLSDMITAYKNGTYQLYISERQVFAATQMAKFLEQAHLPIPQVITQYISQHKKD